MDKIHELYKNITIADNSEGNLSGSLDTTENNTEPEAVDINSKPLPESSLPPVIPEYISHRLDVFKRLKLEYDDEIASMYHKYICVNVPEYNRSIAEISWETRPALVARYLGGEALLEKTVIARVDGKLWDLDRPLEESCTLEFLGFDTPEGKRVFWHSSAHVLGQAAELKFGCLLGLSAVTEDGFFYEIGPEDSNGGKFSIDVEDKEPLEEIAGFIIEEEQKFERLVATKEDLLDMFKYNKYKQHLISTKILNGSTSTVYKCGTFIDLCMGPHIRGTGRIGAFQIETKFPTGALWHADIGSVQRIFGISFPEQEELDKHLKKQATELEETAKRDYSMKMQTTLQHKLLELVAKIF